jgi:5-methylcytosine-specific restriction endonuclease McrA
MRAPRGARRLRRTGAVDVNEDLVQSPQTLFGGPSSVPKFPRLPVDCRGHLVQRSEEVAGLARVRENEEVDMNRRIARSIRTNLMLLPRGLEARAKALVASFPDVFDYEGRTLPRDLSLTPGDKRAVLEYFQTAAAATYLRDRGFCQYCGADLLRDDGAWQAMQIDHVVPRSAPPMPASVSDQWARWFSINSPENLVVSCASCNSAKLARIVAGLEKLPRLRRIRVVRRELRRRSAALRQFRGRVRPQRRRPIR